MAGVSIPSGGGYVSMPAGPGGGRTLSPFGGGGGGGGGGGRSVSGSQGSQVSQSTQQSTSGQAAYGQQQSGSYIPDYLESPILRQIASYARDMAPEVYNWGMQQWAKNQGNIDAMMRNALTYASPQRVASEMGRAQAGVMQGAEAGRQAAIQDLQSYGIDPSSGRYAALDTANRVMAGAAAAGAGNQQREATVAQGAQMANMAQQNSLANTQTGYGASNAFNQLLGTGMQLKFPTLGTTSSGFTTSTGYGQSSGQSSGSGSNSSFGFSGFARGGAVPADDATTGGFVSSELSPSAGAKVDDVDARLNAGEFVIPKDVAQWKGQEFFYKLMAQARKMRAMAGSENGEMGYGEPVMTGYGAN